MRYALFSSRIEPNFDEFFRLSCLEIFFAKLLCSEQFGHSPSIVAH